MKSHSTVALVALLLAGTATQATADPTYYVRYDHGGSASYGVVDGDRIFELDAAPWSGGRRTGAALPRDEVRLLAPAEPSKVFAVGYNYLSHRGDRELPPHPPVFLKLPTAITGPDVEIAARSPRSYCAARRRLRPRSR